MIIWWKYVRNPDIGGETVILREGLVTQDGVGLDRA
jgi:hypothetical protein